MSYAICLDQNTPNFNINNLSSNGFIIYANLGNGFNTVIDQGVPANLLFSFPNGICPYNVNLPQGTTQILVIDQCISGLDVASIFSPANIAAGTITIECCYAIIDIPQGPPPVFCETCPLIFDEFPTSTIGLLVAGNLTSTCGPVTDYVIGWYLNGNYSAPVLTSGYGTLFTPYQFTHPLTGNNSVPVFSGNWEGIIHDIAINGVTYSSVSGSAGGQLIPFESCFDTIVVDPLQCDNGPFQGIAKYTHQINFNSQAAGTTSAPVSLTYALDPTTKYFAYLFDSYYVYDEIEIKWKSGDPSVTTNPSLYSQPIYLEKLKRGTDFPYSNLPPQTNPNIPLSQNTVINNIWPKESNTSITNSYPFGFQRVLTLTSLETSSNVLLPDLLEITITPNPTNNNTQWKAAFQCLDDFDCINCNYSNYPNSLPKISSFYLEKQYGCDAQQLTTYYTGCLNNSDLINLFDNPLTSLNGTLVGSTGNVGGQNSITSPGNGFLPLTPTIICNSQTGGGSNCSPPSNGGTITLNKPPQQIQLTFDLYSDYLHYKNNLNLAYSNINITSPISCPAGSTNLDYYKYFTVTIPIQQSPTANCGDNTILYSYYFHTNDYFNIVYTNDNNPNATSWAITIPQSTMVNCHPILNCNNCNDTINTYINNYNQNVQNQTTFTFTTTIGAKLIDPFYGSNLVYTFQNGTTPSGSVCANTINASKYFSIPWYSTYTIPFIPNPSIPGSWNNLFSLSGSIPCDFSEYPVRNALNDSGWGYVGYVLGVQVRFPNLTSSFNYSLSTNDFEIYSLTNLTATGSYDVTPYVYPLPCPDPFSSLIYSYIGGVPTVYSASYFVGGSPTLTIDP
jgi:hypothetical protein